MFPLRKEGSKKLLHLILSIHSSVLSIQKILTQQIVDCSMNFSQPLYLFFSINKKVILIQIRVLQTLFCLRMLFESRLLETLIKHVSFFYEDPKFRESKFVTSRFWLIDWLVPSDWLVIIAFCAINDKTNHSRP